MAPVGEIGEGAGGATTESSATRKAPRPCVKAKSFVPSTWSCSVTTLANPPFSTAQLRPPSAEVKTPRSVPT
jgi:hypothetical protein